MMTTKEAEEFGCVIVDKILIDRTHFDILHELAALNEQNLSTFLKDMVEFAIEDMALTDSEHIAKLMINKWKKQLGKEVPG